MRRAFPRAALALLLCACQGAAPAPPRPQPPSPAPPLGASSRAAAGDPAAQAPAEERAAAPPAAGAGQEGPAEASAPAEPAAEGAAAPAPVGWVAGQPLTAEDLLVEWHRVAGREVWLVVDKLVATRLAYAEAARLGLRLEPEEVERRVEAERARVAAEVERTSPGTPLEEFVERELEEPFERWLEIVRLGTIRQMIAERAARSWTLQSENRALRVIVVQERELALELLERARSGEDFAALAREHSVDDSRQRDGHVPYVVRQEHSPLARLAFTTAPGELGGPVAIEPSGHFVLLSVLEHREPLPGDWPEIGAAVEASLAAEPLSEAEFLHWKLAMERRYPIDVAPLEDLLD